MNDTPTGRRFQIERALDKSRLHPISRQLVAQIARRINNMTGTIPDNAHPSIGRLARDTGWNRVTVCRRLNDAERAGWLIRDRPPRILAATKHIRTKYTIVIPGEQLAAAAAQAPDPLAQLVTSLLREKTGRTITPQQAGLVVGHIINGHQVDKPEPYIRTVIRNERKPEKWLPVALPQTVRQYEENLARLIQEETA